MRWSHHKALNDIMSRPFKQTPHRLLVEDTLWGRNRHCIVQVAEPVGGTRLEACEYI